MPEPEPKLLHCSEEGCEQTCRTHRWAKTKSGWFQSRDGVLNYCPSHIPDWVAQWRARQSR